MRFAPAFMFAAAGALLAASAAGTAAAAEQGDVVVFATEVTPLSVYHDPHGCQKLPPDAHVLTNHTDRPVTVYADPFCLTPGLTVEPGYGSHVAPGSGSFSA
ncbi:hypothetical protein [Streptomyces cahuitamycinicus]|uniref:Uncharacterized protein n=1 Tax=Streptomyces cahuitamycinicus TaxID=2070367 RepID=A0A2N8TQT8_9ACTN|nr:hypothetical protein [Streptomyces cahuitamycinicus]PNG21360.1 hypothetical protein C1J00_15145 [Streptomyces cahuitamycinicus]